MLWNSLDHADLARTLLAHGHFDGALTACSLGLSKAPESAELEILLMLAYDGLGIAEKALAASERILAAEESSPAALDAHIMRAMIFFEAGDVDQAFASGALAQDLAPNDQYVHVLLGNLLAWNGDLASALPHVEWNWLRESLSLVERFGGRAPAECSDLDGKRVLVAHGQGFGDMLQMARYFSTLRSRASHVTVECLSPSMPLIRRVSGVDDVVEYGAVDADRYDAYVRLMSLPRILGIDSGECAPYLAADPERLERWSARLGASDGYRVGLMWGAQTPQFDKRFIPPERLRLLGDATGVTCYSLMSEQYADLGFNVVHIGESFRDFDDAAAVIAQLDLVITIDSAYAHLAGALGIPTWLLLPRRPDWRWGGSTDTTAWYPSMRLFRETGPGWPTVTERVVSELRRLGARLHDSNLDPRSYAVKWSNDV